MSDLRNTGEWITNKFGYIECSECHSFALSIETGSLINRHMEQYKTHFCPNCGADMRGNEDGND